MKDYYKILQVDKDASPEIIKVAYKLLVKKYHPDLKEGDEKKLAEEKIKSINNAYDVLSDPSKKAEYDRTLINDSISPEQYQLIINENTNLKRELDFFKKKYSSYSNPYVKSSFTSQQYTNMYDNNNSNTNNNYYYKNTNTITNRIKSFFEKKTKTFIAIILTVLIFFIILNIPYVKQYLSNILDVKIIYLIAFLFFGYFYFYRNRQ